MTKKNPETPIYVDANLKISKDNFVKLLTKQIERGEQLLERTVRIVNAYNPYGGFVPNRRNDKVEYEENSKNDFIEEYKRWHSYNIELYKTSFDSPNSTYRHSYESEVGCVILIGNEDVIAEYKKEIRRLINHMKGDIEKIELIPCMYKESENQLLDNKMLTSKKVFIVHGHDEGVRNKVELFVRQIGYEPVILCKRADMGNTIIEKIEREAKDVCFAIVIYTYCDDGKAKGDSELKPRARQNVVFERGFMCSHLGRSRVCALLENGVEQPGDLQGVIYKNIDNGGLWRFAIASEMQAVGLQVDKNTIS